MISAKETYKIASATSRAFNLNKKIQSVIKVKPRKVHKLGPEHRVVNRTTKLETPVADSVVNSQKPSVLKEHFQTYWPHYAVAGAAGIGGLAYLKNKRDKQNAVA